MKNLTRRTALYPSRLQIVVTTGIVAFLLVSGMVHVGCTFEPPLPTQTIRLNQVGFALASPKIAVVLDENSEAFDIRTLDGDLVYSGDLGAPELWPYSGETVRIADFSTFDIPGEYKVVIGTDHESHAFQIRENVHEPVVAAALKAFFYARSLIDLFLNI